MKRIAMLGIALAAMGAGCWVSTDSNVQPPVTSQTPPALEGSQQPSQAIAPTPTDDDGDDDQTPTASNTAPTPPSGLDVNANLQVQNPVMQAQPESVYFTVEMSENGFKPSQITIKKDTIVRFKNVGNTSMWPASNPHPTHTDYQDFDARRKVKPGETYEFRFKNIGTWGCHDHLSPGLTCRIVVTE